MYLDKETGVIAAKPGSGDKVFFEMSTIEPSVTREVGKIIMDAGFGTYFDSPISVFNSFIPCLISRAVFPALAMGLYRL